MTAKTLKSSTSPFSSPLHFCPRLPALKKFSKSALLIFDEKLLKLFPEWISSFDRRVGFAAGESLKDLKLFPARVERLVEKLSGLGAAELEIVVLGGGSVGDFGAFFASVYRRGVKLTMIPSTWLAAVDSAHGGKTALNVGGAKNVLGTFYPASRVILCRELLLSQGPERAEEAWAELLKVAILSGDEWGRKLRLVPDLGASIWKNLRAAIAAKRKIVLRDPFEVKGLRSVLNLGHSLGHVLEAGHGLPHGRAVALGLGFALEWSVHRRFLVRARAYEFLALLPRFAKPSPMREADFLHFLKLDKKLDRAGRLRFIFVKAWGRPLILKVSVAQMLAEARRQAFVK